MGTSIEHASDVQVVVRVQQYSATRVTYAAGEAVWTLARVALGVALLVSGTVARILGTLSGPLTNAGRQLLGGDDD